jgi:hypothetical protein
MMDNGRLDEVREMLEADGYQLEVEQQAERRLFRIVATENACPDCLVPKRVMAGIMSQVTGAPVAEEDLVYPSSAEH